jgi:hypothetical protein
MAADALALASSANAATVTFNFGSLPIDGTLFSGASHQGG